ncbi:hypothetical protein C8046_03415 [Serinibacter arcticus]|uniref:SLH domain-containing protein n=1 Tax=Serinibacter arcticus TaxID=1655435 RepID=A0A2U1ZSF6_9MICO|nr:RICIN domain-containing protein [Serinibacter arcticus]PWD49873.1 hypothetical protein C8046_03415 [Serinibacter arcticus]
MPRTQTRTRVLARTSAVVAAIALAATTAVSAAAYTPTGGTLYQLPDTADCLKGRGNCAVYPKSTQLPNGRLVASFERATVVPASGGATGLTLPIYASDDYGDTWAPLAEVPAPAYLSDDPEVAQYTSNWTNPNLYVLPETVGDLEEGTLLLSSIVSGEDRYYTERKAADPSWVPNNDGDRENLAIALYSSTDDGATWAFEHIVAEGGWQGGSAGATGSNVSTANLHRQVDPLWEPHLMVHDGELIVYYSDENDYLSVDPTTGVPVINPANDTATDSHGQVLVHRTWDGTAAPWSEPVIDVAGLTEDVAGTSQIGGGRPGMTTVVPTTDGKWLMTFEYFGGGANTRFKIADDPREFGSAPSDVGLGVNQLPVAPGSRTLAMGGSPVLLHLEDGRLVYNASGSGSIWVNESGRSDGRWVEYQTTLGSGYSRNLQYVEGTGQLLILQGTWGGPTSSAVLRFAHVDIGDSDGAYYQLVNRATGQVLGTGDSVNDANLGSFDEPDVQLEAAGSATVPDTQYWRPVTKPGGAVTLLNAAGGRAAAIWTGNPSVGQRVGQWVDDSVGGSWRLVDGEEGHVRLQVASNSGRYLTGSAPDAPVTIQNATTDGTQDWQLVRRAPSATDLTPARADADLVVPTTVDAGAAIELDAARFTPTGLPRNADVEGEVYVIVGDDTVPLGAVAFDGEQRGSITLPSDLEPGTAVRLAVVFERTATIWDEVTIEGDETISFVDVTPSTQFSFEISWLAQQGISTGWVTGSGEREFRPLSPINRDAMAAFLYREAGSPEFQAPKTSPFVDVATDDLFYDEIAWLAEQEITTGWVTASGEREFRPLSPINRDAMAAFLYRAAGSPAFEAPETSPFVDVATDNQYYAEISWLAHEEIATGWKGNDGTSLFQPLVPINRDAMAAFLYRFAHLAE